MSANLTSSNRQIRPHLRHLNRSMKESNRASQSVNNQGSQIFQMLKSRIICITINCRQLRLYSRLNRMRLAQGVPCKSKRWTLHKLVTQKKELYLVLLPRRLSRHRTRRGILEKSLRASQLQGTREARRAIQSLTWVDMSARSSVYHLTIQTTRFLKTITRTSSSMWRGQQRMFLLQAVTMWDYPGSHRPVTLKVAQKERPSPMKLPNSLSKTPQSTATSPRSNRVSHLGSGIRWKTLITLVTAAIMERCSQVHRATKEM